MTPQIHSMKKRNKKFRFLFNPVQHCPIDSAHDAENQVYRPTKINHKDVMDSN